MDDPYEFFADIFRFLRIFVPTFVRLMLWEYAKSLVMVFATMAYLFLPLILILTLPEDMGSTETLIDWCVLWLVINVFLLVFGACVAYIVSNDERDVSLSVKIKASLGGAIFYFFYCIITFAILFALIATIDHINGRPFLGEE